MAIVGRKFLVHENLSEWLYLARRTSRYIRQWDDPRGMTTTGNYDWKLFQLPLHDDISFDIGLYRGLLHFKFY